jgi:ectoine hydroxylase-related dioxygenase (phytanoyl-CoA dioxygenase family)
MSVVRERSNTEAKLLLSPEEIEFFEREGYVVPKYKFSPDDVAKMQRLTRKVVVDNPDLVNVPLVCLHVPGNQVQAVKTTKEWLDIAAHPDLLDMSEQLIGPDLVLWDCAVFYKHTTGGPATPWHRDGVYWPIQPLATLSVWIAVFDSFIENACLRMIPKSHAAKEIGRHSKELKKDVIFQHQLKASEFDESSAVDLEMEAGQLVFFTPFTIHGANRNFSDQERAGVSMRYMPATSHFNRSAMDPEHARTSPGAAHHLRPLMLVRGVDRSGKNDFVTGHPQGAE